MLWIIGFPLLLIAGIILLLMGFGLRKEQANQGWGAFAGAGAIALAFALVWTAFAIFKSVDTGHVGLVYQFGNIVDHTDSGLVQIAPWQKLTQGNIQIQRITYDLGKENSAFSAETQDVFATATLNFQVEPKDIVTLYRTVGPNFANVLIEQRVFKTVKQEIVKFNAVDVAPNRQKIQDAIRDSLETQLQPYSIKVVDFQLGNLDFDPEFKEAVRNKVIAAQKAQQAHNELAQTRNEAQKILISARKQAAANRKISGSINDNLIRFTYAQAYGRLADKIAKNIQVLAIPSGSIFNTTQLLQGISENGGK